MLVGVSAPTRNGRVAARRADTSSSATLGWKCAHRLTPPRIRPRCRCTHRLSMPLAGVRLEELTLVAASPLPAVSEAWPVHAIHLGCLRSPGSTHIEAARHCNNELTPFLHTQPAPTLPAGSAGLAGRRTVTWTPRRPCVTHVEILERSKKQGIPRVPSPLVCVYFRSTHTTGYTTAEVCAGGWAASTSRHTLIMMNMSLARSTSSEITRIISKHPSMQPME